MELKFSPLSPYVRKVSVTAHELGIAQRIRLTPVKTREEPDKIAPFNPLGKIPTLVTDAGAVLYDSPVICEYLDAEFGNHRLLPASGARRWDILTRVALADGMMDAAILLRTERLRAVEKQSSDPIAWQPQDFIAWQLRKIRAGLDHMEGSVGDVRGVAGPGADRARLRAGLHAASGRRARRAAQVATSQGMVRSPVAARVVPADQAGAVAIASDRPWPSASSTSASASSAGAGAASS